MIVLRTVPWALHVRLGGPRDARIKQGAGRAGIEPDAARRRQEDEDTARIDYVRRAYRVDPWDAGLYHLILDSTAVPLDTCVELIVTAARARVQQPRETAPA
jgi:cytidylate kinase